MKLLLALSALATVSLAATPLQDVTPQFIQEPTRALRTEAGVTPGAVGDIATSTFTIGQAIVPAIMGAQGKKDCHQLACWIGAPTEACGMTAANQAQRELMRGRNSYGVESVSPQGMWVRYWRTQFSPPDRGDVAEGKCTDGSKFVVTNCMATGKVYC